MKAKNIFIVRHGQSLSNASHKDGLARGAEIHRLMPDYKIPLTELGIEQSIAAGKELALFTQPWGGNWSIYNSPFLRTRQTTVNIISQLKDTDICQIREDPRLREQEWWNKCTMDDSQLKELIKFRDDFGSFFYRFADGESGADIYDRCSGFLDTLYRDFEKHLFASNVLIVTHSFTMRILLMRWFHWTFEEFEAVRSPKNCEIIRLELNSYTNKYDLKSELIKRT